MAYYQVRTVSFTEGTWGYTSYKFFTPVAHFFDAIYRGEITQFMTLRAHFAGDQYMGPIFWGKSHLMQMYGHFAKYHLNSGMFWVGVI